MRTLSNGPYSLMNTLMLLLIVLAVATISEGTEAIQKSKLLQTKLSNYRQGKAVIVVIHITHHAGTFIRTKLARANSEHIQNPIKFYDKLPYHMEGTNRSNFFRRLLPSLYQNNTNTSEMLPPPTSPITTDSDVIPTKWDVLYNGEALFGHNVSFFMWFELSWKQHEAEWTYHPFSPYNEPDLWLLDWESPHVISVIVTRNPMDRLLSYNPIIKRYMDDYYNDVNNTNATLSQQFYDYAHKNGDTYTNNYALRSLTTPYYDISSEGLQSAKKLLNRMDYILDQDCLNENLLQLSHDIGWDQTEVISQPTPHHEPARDRIHNDSIYEYLRAKNQLDIELYEWSKQKSLVVCPAITTTTKTAAGTNYHNYQNYYIQNASMGNETTIDTGTPIPTLSPITYTVTLKENSDTHLSSAKTVIGTTITEVVTGRQNDTMMTSHEIMMDITKLILAITIGLGIGTCILISISVQKKKTPKRHRKQQDDMTEIASLMNDDSDDEENQF